MRNVFDYSNEEDYLEHFGIKGQKWGIRRFQNSDGTLTQEGIDRYNKKRQKYQKKFYKAANKSDEWMDEAERYNKKARKFLQTAENREEYARRSDNALRFSTWNARKAVRAWNKIDKLDKKVLGKTLDSLDPEMIRRGYELIERNNTYQMYNLNTIYKSWNSDNKNY